MKIGTICFAIERGLGYLAKSFYDNGIVTDACVLLHGGMDTHIEWYPGCLVIGSLKSREQQKQMEEWCAELDVLLIFETAFHWDVIEACRKAGTLTVLIPMYECTPCPLPFTPDRFICPSSLDKVYYPDNSVEIPVPIDIDWTQRTVAKRYVHNAGWVGLKGRNGTRELLQAMEFVESDLTLTIRSENTDRFTRLLKEVPGINHDERVDIQIGHISYEDLRTGFDVCVAPELFNGMSFPLMEARASGMLVLTTDREPANEWLPEEGLIHVEDYVIERVGGPCRGFRKALVNPRDIAEKMDEWYEQDITEYSLAGKYWAENMTWESLKPIYMETIQGWYEDIREANRVVRS